MSEKTTFTPVSRNLIKQLEKTNLTSKCILFYSYACRLQAIKNKKSKESENNCLSVPELSKELNLDRKTVKKFCEELVDLGLMYHNVEKSIYENTYQALFLPATAYYENNTWYNDFITCTTIPFTIYYHHHKLFIKVLHTILNLIKII